MRRRILELVSFAGVMLWCWVNVSLGAWAISEIKQVPIPHPECSGCSLSEELAFANSIDKYAFVTIRSIGPVQNEEKLWVRHGLEERVIHSRDAIWGLTWSPSGRYLSFNSGDEEGRGTFMIYDDVRDTLRQVRPVGAGGMGVAYSCWSPDGRKVAYTEYVELRQNPEEVGMEPGQKRTVMIYNLDSDTCGQVTEGDIMAWSPKDDILVVGKLERSKEVEPGFDSFPWLYDLRRC